MRTRSTFVVLLLAPSVALAQPSSDTTGPDVSGPLPEPASDADPQPPVAGPGVAGGIVRQAGVGGQVGYGRAGVLELGGSAGFTMTNDLTQVSIAPSIGWFLADNFQLSGLLGYTYVRAESDGGDDTDASLTSLLVEPSYHLPLSREAFLFGGVGMGAAYVSGPGLGLAFAPRLGANFLVGRSGVLTPALSWQYTTHESMEVPGGVAVAVSAAVMANVGYTVLW